MGSYIYYNQDQWYKVIPINEVLFIVQVLILFFGIFIDIVYPCP